MRVCVCVCAHVRRVAYACVADAERAFWVKRAALHVVFWVYLAKKRRSDAFSHRDNYPLGFLSIFSFISDSEKALYVHKGTCAWLACACTFVHVREYVYVLACACACGSAF